MALNKKHKISGAFLIGLFVIFGLTLLIITIIWLGKTQFMKENIYYVTYFDGSVEGLERGSPVKYLGVPVGSVDRVNVAPDGKLVEVIMQIDKGVEIDSNLRVKAELAGLAGGKFLQLSYPSNPDLIKLYPKLSFDPPYPMIKSSPSGIQEIEIALNEVMNNLKMLKVEEISISTVRLLTASSKFFENEDLYIIINKFSEASEKLNNILLKVDSSKFIANIENTSRKLLESSDQLLTFGNKLNQQITDLMLTQKVDKAFAQFDTTVTGARNVIHVLGSRTEEILLTMNETMQQLQSTNKQLRKSIRSLSENPAQLLFSEPPAEEK